MTIRDLGYNFRAIYDATHHEPSTARPQGKLPPVILYSNLCPYYIPLFDGDLNFRTWTNGLYHDNNTRFIMIDSVQKALKETHELFHRFQKQFITEDYPKMRQYINKVSNLGKNDEFDESEYVPLRTDIQNFYLHTYHLLKSIHTDPNVRMREIFQHHFCSKCFDHMELLEKSNALIALQGEIVRTLPLKSLVEGCFGRAVTDGSLQELLKTLKDKEVPIEIFHQAVRAVAEYAAKYKVTAADLEENTIPSIDDLEYLLFEIDPTYFVQPSSNHMEWRNSLKPESEIVSIGYSNSSEGQQAIRYRFILGPQIGKKQQGFDHSIYFEIKDCYETVKFLADESAFDSTYEPLIEFDKTLEKENTEFKNNCVIFISINETIPYIRNLKSQLCEWVNLSQTQFIDRQGRFSLVEKLHEDSVGLTGKIPHWIKTCFKKNKNVPLSFDPLAYPQKFLLNNDNKLTAVKFIRPMENFSFNAWEQFIFDVVKGDKNAFKYVLTQSHLGTLDEAQLIRSTVLSCFDESQFNPHEQCTKKSYQDKNVLKLALDLRVEMKKLLDNCLRALESKGVAKISLGDIQNALLKAYVESGGISILLPGLQDEIINQFS